MYTSLTPRAPSVAFAEMCEYINEIGGNHHLWYVGVTSDLMQRLCDEHSVPREGHPCISRRCFENSDARLVEQGLLNIGCDGGGGGGDKSSVFVYAYRKGATTKP